MKSHCPPFLRGSGSGFSLVEVALALGIAGFCLSAIFALLPIGLTTNQNSFQQSEAANLTSLLTADLRNAPKIAAGRSPIYKIPLPSATQTGTSFLYFTEQGNAVKSLPEPEFSINAGAKYCVMVASGLANGRNATPVRILVTWPAQAAVENATGRLATVTLLDRN